MKRLFLITTSLIFSITWMVSCVDLDIPTTSIFTADDMYNEPGMKAYMAGMYRNLPMEDFNYNANNGNGAQWGYFADIPVRSLWSTTGELINRDGVSFHVWGYWSKAFEIIRQANTLVKDLPNYPEVGARADEWIAEAKFIRAYMYFQLAKRYGGLPKILEPQYLDSEDESVLWVKRVSHADTYDFILKDLDDAIDGMPATSDAGRANKYVAAAFKSRVALHAASTARYGSMKFQDWEVDGVLLQGISANKANDYFKQAWDAAMLVEDGKYELHRAVADKTANYIEIWEQAASATNKESIWIRKFDINNFRHSYDTHYGTIRMVVTAGDRGGGPTLDWMELFDGVPLDANGHFYAFDQDGYYTVYDNCQQLWNQVEPRLRANLLIPGNTYIQLKYDVRAGLIDKKFDPALDKFKKISIDDGYNNGAYRSAINRDNYPAPSNPWEGNDQFIIYSTYAANQQAQTDLYDVDGVKIYKNGLDGPRMSYNGASNNTATGLQLHKHLDLSRQCPGNNQSTQPWIEIRYAEVLLNRAEAAIELAQNGEASHGGKNMLQDALECINDVRDRAGARLLAGVSELSTDPAFTNWNRPGPKGQGGFVEAPNRALQILRVERYKELAFESKIYWDLYRWFTFDTQINNYYRRGLYSFMYANGATVDAAGVPDGKYIYDAKISEQLPGTVTTFQTNQYYETIPPVELKNNPLLQKNRNQ